MIDDAHVCGFSLGAAMALRYAYDRPKRVRSLVLGGLSLGPLVQMGMYLGPNAESWRAQALAQLERLTHPSERAHRYFSYVHSVLTTIPLAPWLDAGREPRPPTLGMFGERDPLQPAAVYQWLELSSDARSRLEVIERAGHGSCFTHARFREAAIAFVTQQAAVARL